MTNSSLEDLTDYLKEKKHTKHKDCTYLFWRTLAIVLLGVIVVVAVIIAIYSPNLFNIGTAPTATRYQKVFLSCSSCLADIDKNNVVGAGDISAISLCMNKDFTQLDALGGSCAEADLNGDRMINKLDLDCIKAHFRESCINQ